jgi:hypothetical protein
MCIIIWVRIERRRRQAICVSSCCFHWEGELAAKYQDFLAYFALLVAVCYVGFVLWKLLRGSFDDSG